MPRRHHGVAGPLTPFIDTAAMTRIATDLVARSSRLWVDLWFANLDRASAAFWDDVRRTARDR